MLQAAHAAQLTRDFLIKKGYWSEEIPHRYIASPHYRTLQTAASFVYEWKQQAQSEILLNASIVLSNGSSAWSKAGGKCPFLNGALGKFSSSELTKALDSKATNLQWDKLADEGIYNQVTAGPEKSGGKRYSEGFKDIVQKHFIQQKVAGK
jgi:hypothetical protein